MKPLMRNNDGKIVWTVTTSDDTVTKENKNDYLYVKDTYYVLPEPRNSEKFVGWLNTSDNKVYQPGDNVRVIYGMHFIAQYNEK